MLIVVCLEGIFESGTNNESLLSVRANKKASICLDYFSLFQIDIDTKYLDKGKRKALYFNIYHILRFCLFLAFLNPYNQLLNKNDRIYAFYTIPELIHDSSGFRIFLYFGVYCLCSCLNISKILILCLSFANSNKFF